MSDQNDREKLGGGIAPFASGAANVGAGSGALGGGLGVAGKAGALATIKSFLASKALILMTVAGGMAYGGHGMVDMNTRGFGVEPAKPALAFSDRSLEGYVEKQRAAAAARVNPGGAAASDGSALDLAKKANEGYYGGMEVPAKPASKEETEKVEEAKDGPAGALDPAAMAQQMGAEISGATAGSKAKAGLGGRFGQLSAASGGGGGSKAQLGGGPGMSSGIGGRFAQSNLSNSRLSQMAGGRKVGAGRSMQAARNLGGTNLTGKNARKLAEMSSAMGAVRSGQATDAAAVHNQQWSRAGAGGQALQGAGAGDIGFSEDEGPGGGSPMDTNSTSGPNTYDDTYGTDGIGDEGKNVTPYQQMADTAQAMLLLASAMLLISFLVGMYAKSLAATAVTPVQWAAVASMYSMAKYIAYVAAALAAITALMGIMIMMQGQAMQGAIFTGVGALLTVLAMTAAEGNAAASTASAAANATATSVAAAAGSTGGVLAGGAAVGGGGAIAAHNTGG